MVEVKICGVTSVEQAVACVDLGASAIGLNFWPGTPRCVEVETARAVVDELGARATVVGVFVDASVEHIAEIREQTGIGWVQLHGSEPPEVVGTLLPEAYKVIGVRGHDAIALAEAYPGEHLLLDAAVTGAMPGGTGHTFDWTIAAEIAKHRKLTLAGGLTPDNVAAAVAQVKPYRVDVSSGVESDPHDHPGHKDLELVRAFVQAARSVKDDR